MAHKKLSYSENDVANMLADKFGVNEANVFIRHYKRHVGNRTTPQDAIPAVSFEITLPLSDEEAHPYRTS